MIERREPSGPATTSSVQTFLIADLRGYTRFSQEHGDEAASRLAQTFAHLVREAVPALGGELLELRGDEALCVFSSARQAVGAAVGLQRRFRERRDGEPALALGVGIGLDAGEAVPTDGGYRGRALNVAARLCSLARPGEILASETVATLAGRGEAASYAPRRPAQVKGLQQPVRLVEVVPQVKLPPLPAEPRAPRPLKRALLVPAALAIAGAVAAALILFTGGSDVAVLPNSLAVIDPATNRVVDTIPVGDGPTRIAVGGGRVWVVNSGAQTISLVDARTRALRKTFAVGATPADLALGAGSVWIGDGVKSSVVEVSAENVIAVRTIEPVEAGDASAEHPRGQTRAGTGDGSVAFGLGSLWALVGEQTLARIDPDTGNVLDRIRLRGLTTEDVAVGEGAVWVTGCCSGMTRVDPATGRAAGIPPGANGSIAVGFGTVWVAEYGGRQLWQIDPDSGDEIPTARCGRQSLDVVVGEGAVWVACSDGAVLRVNPFSGDVTETIPVGGTPTGIAAGEGAVWVAVS